ncbi:MAG TPA: 2-hydroxyacyl-CoA dehydratase family protein [Candidatus Acidoferrum sp.]|nr:2-hydroxyacyl-CoA dehydratase family protein [Candidatus Acidoferrum sp.]
MNVYYSSPWIPAEWIQAHGFEPRGAWAAEDFGRGALPLAAGVCAFSEAVLRFAETHSEAAMIFTTTCDQLRRSFDVFAATPGRRAFLFNIPATWQSTAADRMFQSELERLGRFLEELGGHSPSTTDLANIIEHRGRVRQDLLELAPRCSARQFAEAIARFHENGSCAAPDPVLPPAAGAIPLALVGGPLTVAQGDVLDLIEAAGARVVLNATETGERSLLPVLAPGDFRDHPFAALARHCFENIADVFQRPNTRLYSWLKDRLAARRARGIVLWVHTGCDLWRAEAQSLRETFQLPVLVLEADEMSGGSRREADRIQAFVETRR